MMSLGTKAWTEEVEAGNKLQEAIITELEELRGSPVVKSHEEFRSGLITQFKTHDLKITTPLVSEIIMALSERDDSAEIVTDAKGSPVPDTELKRQRERAVR
jgi:hypothetical protein